MTSLKGMAAAPTSYRCLTRRESRVGGLPQGTCLGTRLDDSRNPLTDTMPSRWLAARGSLARRRDIATPHVMRRVATREAEASTNRFGVAIACLGYLAVAAGTVLALPASSQSGFTTLYARISCSLHRSR
jgi:hypothetical protein